MTTERRGDNGRRVADDPERLARIEEQLRGLSTKIDENFKAIGRRLDNKVSRVEFIPVKNIAYGLVALTMMAVLGALIALVLTSSGSLPVVPP